MMIDRLSVSWSVRRKLYSGTKNKAFHRYLKTADIVQYAYHTTVTTPYYCCGDAILRGSATQPNVPAS